MPLTPRPMITAARAAIAAIMAGEAAMALSAAPPAPLFAAVLGYAATLATLAAFPRLRRDDLLAALAGAITLCAFIAAFPGARVDVAAWAGGIAGIGLAVTPLAIAELRRLAARNPHMSFVEWRTLEGRQRRASDAPRTPNRAVPLLPAQLHRP